MMKITKAKLKQIIKEEASKALTESYVEDGGDWHDLLNQAAKTNAYAMEKAGTKGPGYSREEMEAAISDDIGSALEAIRGGYSELMHDNGIDFDELVEKEAGVSVGPPDKPFGRERDTWEG